MADKFNVDTLIADAKAARAKAIADADAAAKAAALAKKNKDTINKARLQAEPQINYAKSLESEMLTLEGTLRAYATRVSRGDVPTSTEQAEFDRTVAQYKSLSDTYTKTNDSVVKIFNAAPGADVATLTGNKDLGAKTVDASGKVVDKAAPGINWSEYAIDATGRVTHGNVAPVFVSTSDGKGNVQPVEYKSMSEARAAFLKNYSTPQALASLQNTLVNKHYIKSSQIADGTWVGGLDTLLTKYTTKLVSDALYSPGTKSVDTNQYLASTSSLGGAGTPTQYKTITTRGDAKKELDNYLTDLIGRPSTPQEEEVYYTQLHALEQKAIRTVSSGTTTGSELGTNDHVLLAANVAKKSLAGTDVEKLLTSGSRAATDIATLQQYAASYGVEMSSADALKYVASGLGQQDYLKKQEERIRQTAITLHPQLKDHFQAGGTYKDIADQYKYTKQNKLGVVVTDSLKDKDISDAIASGKSITDFNRALQSHPDFGKSPEAHQTVADFISNIAQTWGLG